MAGESWFRSLLNRFTSGGEPPQDTVEQNNITPVVEAVLNEFNTQLGASYINLISQTSRGSAPYSAEQITRMAQEPMQYIKELRRWAR